MQMLRPGENLKCILLADDLTGACDTGAQFARCGLSCAVELNTRRARPLPNVLALSTGSRRDTLEDSQRKLESIARRFPVKTSLVLKKLDSTLRGNVSHETELARRLCAADYTLLTPAFPAMKRIVRNGILEWSDCAGSGQVNITGLLMAQGISGEEVAVLDVHEQDATRLAKTIGHLFESGARWIVPNTSSQDHLRNLVAAGLRLECRVLWAGSAGLGSALAEQLAEEPSNCNSPLSMDGPVLFCVGSTHSVTSRQKERLAKEAQLLETEALPQNLDTVLRALRENRQVALSLDCDTVSKDCLRDLADGLHGVRLAGIVLTGGDTASLMCSILGVDWISLRGEVAPGIPWGILEGGELDRLPVITKSGGFGDEDALVLCADFLSSSKRVLQ